MTNQLPEHLKAIKERHRTHNIANDIGVQAHACCAHFDRGILLTEVERLRAVIESNVAQIGSLIPHLELYESDITEETMDDLRLNLKANQEALNHKPGKAGGEG